VEGIARILRRVLIAPIKFYSRRISPLFPRRCKYHPTCSRYAITAIETHGPIKGLILALWRLIRCNPFSYGGYDPVPPKGKWRSVITEDDEEEI